MKLTFAAILLTILAGLSCSEDSRVPSASIQDVKAKYETQLMTEPGVVSVGIGRDDQHKPVIVVGLDRPRAETVEALPKELDGYAVRATVIGPLKAQ